MTYRLNPRLKALARWTKLANNGARWVVESAAGEILATGRYLSDYAINVASRRPGARIRHVQEEIDRLIE